MTADFLQGLKQSAGGSGPQLRLPVGTPPRAFLRPIAVSSDRMRDADVAQLTEWRNRFVDAFLTRFVNTDDRTRKWLSEYVANDDTRVLFMVDLPDGTTIGYMGLAYIDWNAKRGEADAIVRGNDAPKGLMTDCMKTLIGWGLNQLGLESIGVRVLSSNPALEFYRKFGFVEQQRVPLRKTDRNGDEVWVEDADAANEPELVHMNLRDDVVAELKKLT
ncbi:MAG: aminotransferase [Verrucomicrobiales bacterium]|nr:aminotransferase [Verrucomicrobiales bacterium]|tara:strand:- start:9427 stop:10080 length:654 start_codon:yes stop_codon:yes gene_type:complete